MGFWGRRLPSRSVNSSPKFKEAGVPFAVIPMQDYGMIRGDRVMQMALDMIEEAKK